MKQIDQLFVISGQYGLDQQTLDRIKHIATAAHSKVIIGISGYSTSLELEHLLSTSEFVQKAQNSYLKTLEKHLMKSITELKVLNIDVEVVSHWHKDTCANLLSMIEQYNPDLVIKAMEAHTWFTRWLHNSLDSQLIRQCHKPIWFVNQHKPWQNQRAHILSAINPVNALETPDNTEHHVMEVSLLVSNLLDASLDVLHCYDPTPPHILMENHRSNISEYRANLAAKHKQAFHQFIDEHPLPEEHQHILEGDIEEVLPTIAKQLKAQLLVIGAKNHSRLQEFLTSHTAEYIASHIENIDTLVIKPSSEVHSSIYKQDKQTDSRASYHK